MTVLIDKYNREITRFRISLTPDCNLNCMYCHREGYTGSAHRMLTLDEIKQLSKIANKYQVHSVKLTGGEPLIHPNVVDIVKIFRKYNPKMDISMTTNGLLLPKLARPLKEAGLNRLNIGCDSFSNPSVKSLIKVKDGLLIAKEVGFNPIKMNMVLLKGINEDELPTLMKYAKENDFILQIIELINSNPKFYEKYHVDPTPLSKEFEKNAVEIRERPNQGRKQYVLKDGTIVEIVKPMHNAIFCANCHTMRITHDYKFQPCLMRTDNLIPISRDIEVSIKRAMEQRIPYVR